MEAICPIHAEPIHFEVLRKRLESEADEKHQGTKEYISILCLLEKYSLKRLTKAIEQALRYRNPYSDIIKQYCLDYESPTIELFSLAGREHLAGVTVYPAKLDVYNELTGKAVTI